MAHQSIDKDDFMNPHKNLHGNISLLLNFHPPSDDQFRKSISENMFRLPNKKGFFEVTNYLNSIIDKEKWNSIITWPVINNKDEMKFRRAVVKFTADLNSLYDSHVVPPLNPSVLISPGGIQVARFILKLSEYAIRKYMEKNLGIENTLQCLKFNRGTSNSVKQKLETVALHKNVQCLNELEATKKNVSYALEQRKLMQQQLLKLRASNAVIEREIIQEAPDNNSQEYVEQWSNELNKRLEKRQSCIDYLAGIDNSVTRYHQAAKTILEKGASNLILDGSKIKSPTGNNTEFLSDLTNYFKTNGENAKRLALELKSTVSEREVSQLSTPVQKIGSEIHLERMRLEQLEKDILNHTAESQKAISELEPIAFSCIIDEEKIPPEIQNYAASPALNFAKADLKASRLPIVSPVQGNHILDWVKTNLFKETENVSGNKNTPLKREKQSQTRAQLNLRKGPSTPKKNSFVPVRTLFQDGKTQTPVKPKSQSHGLVAVAGQSHEFIAVAEQSQPQEQDSIVLPHDLSVSTASPCNSPLCVSPNTPQGLTSWQPAVPSTVSSTAVSSITSPNTWAEHNEIDFFSSTPFTINNNSVCSLTADHQSQDMCQSSPSGAVHLPADMNTTGNRNRKMRPSLENIIARYKALKRNQMEKSDE